MITETNVTAAQRKQEGFNIKYQEKVQIFRQRIYLGKRIKTSLFIYFSSYCIKTMQQCIEEHPDYNTLLNNPIELLKAIQILMHDPVHAQYPFASMTSALTRLLNVRQTPVENLVII